MAAQAPVKEPFSKWIFIACGIWLVGLGAYFAVLRPPLLPEDPRYIGSTLEQINASLPGLAGWLSRVFAVMGGFMAAAGAMTLFLALTSVPARTRGTGWTLAAAGLLTVVLMSAVNFMIGSDFRWLLLVPALLWGAGMLGYCLERRADRENPKESI
jgi:hypothetical protein